MVGFLASAGSGCGPGAGGHPLGQAPLVRCSGSSSRFSWSCALSAGMGASRPACLWAPLGKDPSSAHPLALLVCPEGNRSRGQGGLRAPVSPHLPHLPSWRLRQSPLCPGLSRSFSVLGDAGAAFIVCLHRPGPERGRGRGKLCSGPCGDGALLARSVPASVSVPLSPSLCDSLSLSLCVSLCFSLSLCLSQIGRASCRERVSSPV